MTENTNNPAYLTLVSTHNDFINDVLAHATDRRDPILSDLAHEYLDALQSGAVIIHNLKGRV